MQAANNWRSIFLNKQVCSFIKLIKNMTRSEYSVAPLRLAKTPSVWFLVPKLEQ